MGKVILIGAGPGDPELLTLKAAKYLQQADVIITDRLVGKDIIKTFARPDAEIICAGKQGGRSCSTPQLAINALLADRYAPGKIVVRLKGGDVAFYSNVLDELITLRENGIPYEIIPGITAASGASAYTGIPLTARGFATGVRFITFSKNQLPDKNYWRSLIKSGDTLVFYMSANILPGIAGGLLNAGADKELPLAVIEQATTPAQKVFRFSLNEAAGLQQTFASPSLLIIGKVAALHERFAWLAEKPSTAFFEDAILSEQVKNLIYA